MGTSSSGWNQRGKDTVQRADCFSHENFLNILSSDLEGQYDFLEEGKLENWGVGEVGKEWLSVRQKNNPSVRGVW